MKLQVIYKNARCAVLECVDGSIFQLDKTFDVYVNGEKVQETDRVIFSVYGLKPQTMYTVELAEGEERIAEAVFTTDYEFVTLNVKDFGAKGDGENNDTAYIQAAIMACPKDSRVLIPAGTYRITSLFLKDDLKLELEKGAVLSAYTDRTMYPVFPAMIQSYDEEDEYNLGTWEGNPLPMFSGIITGVNVKNAVIYGNGVIEGNAGAEEGNWWNDPKTMNIAFRPRMIFLNHCEHVVMQGITVQNSPSWNIHPYFSDHLRFLDLTVLNPKDSPNTDGLDPESCRDLEIAGVYFSLGDDCIAVKSGKIYMGAKHRRPSEDICIRQCCMRDGHGSVTIGSEMAGGVKNLVVKDCRFLHTDRGLRIKTRRGRGKDAIIEGVLFDHIYMDHVMTPFVANSFYFCDPDGHTEYVRTKEALPVDERTPDIRSLTFRNIQAENCHVAAAYFYGLPERKIGRIEMENVHVTYADEPQKGVPAMMEGVEPMTRLGVYANQVKNLLLKNVTVEGQEGQAFLLENIDSEVIS
ncbi:MAG: glycoside hydrolase family 28 protein [Lachnospiraceae bacterium]|nr:glycoside hydrolase family 28 protein [Lachnospiraceae bacterium]